MVYVYVYVCGCTCIKQGMYIKKCSVKINFTQKLRENMYEVNYQSNYNYIIKEKYNPFYKIYYPTLLMLSPNSGKNPIIESLEIMKAEIYNKISCLPGLLLFFYLDNSI